MIFNIGIFSIALLSVIPYGSGYFTYGNFPVHTTYFPSFAYPRTFVAPSWTTLPATTVYGEKQFGEDTGFQVGFRVKAKDLCANQGILRTRAGPSKRKSPFFLPKLPSVRPTEKRPSNDNEFKYIVPRSQGNVEWNNEQVHTFFTQFDQDGSGTMTFQEFKRNFEFLVALGGGVAGQTLLQANTAYHYLFYLGDTDSSGALNENEYGTLLKKMSQQDDTQSFTDVWTKEEVNNAIFRTIDEDNDGSASIDEMNKFMITSGYILTVYELQQLMQELDANHDGKINYNEMTKMMDAECLEPQTYLTSIKSPNSPRPAGNPGRGGWRKPL